MFDLMNATILIEIEWEISWNIRMRLILIIPRALGLISKSTAKIQIKNWDDDNTKEKVANLKKMLSPDYQKTDVKRIKITLFNQSKQI